VGSGAFTLTLTGSGYIAASQVQWNGSNRATTFVSSTQLTAAISATDVANSGTASVTVVNPPPGGGTSAASTFHINTNPAPTVTSISPTSGSTAGGTSVTIGGTGFLTGATVTLGGTAATNVVVVSSTSITAKTAAHAAGAVNVVVTNTDTQSGTLTNGYTYTNSAPTVTSISPTSGSTSGGTSVTIGGTGFLTGATVTLGGIAATNIVVVSSTSITANTPAHAVGTVNVVVTNTDSQSGTLTNGYTYTNPAPTVTSISPTSGPALGGTSVTIGGTGFLTGATVTLGGTAATSVVVVSSTSITAKTAAHAAGTVNVVVTNTDSQSGTLTNGFTYNAAPTVTSISPTSGSTSGGTPVTIGGTGFLTGATVTLGGTAATGVVVVNSTTITATTGAHAAGTVNVVVTNTDAQTGTLTNGYTYSATAPTVTSISPTSGPAAGGTPVTITGTNFVSGATVTLGGTAATSVVVVSSTTITATTAAHAAGTVNVVVTNTDTQSGTLINGYTYTNPAPTVTSISPTSGPASGGTPVTIGGTGFLTGATVTLGGTAATNVVVVSSTSITAKTAAHAAGAVNVVVTNTDTQSGTLTNGFTYNAAPTVTSISPTSGSTAGGTPVTIGGTGFVTGATVTLGGTAATNVVVVSSTSITAKTAAHAAGAVNVVVTNTDTQSGTLTNGYTYTNPAPTVTSISPTSGSTLGGTPVTIGGTGFLTGATVTLGGTAATGVVVVSSTTITATTGAHAAGTVNVVVTNTDTQSGTLTSGYTYTNPAPTVTSISPTSGPALGGTPVTIGGTGFLTGATVTLGGTAATGVVVVSSTTITATTAAHAAGTVSVVVTNTDTQSGSLPNGFTYNAAPTVTSISPTSGSTAGGTPVTIRGTGFLTGATVTLGGTAATGVVVVNSTTITATTGAHAAGTVNVVVTNTDTQSGTLTNGFTYSVISSVSSISPTTIGAGTPGFQLTVTGTGFVSGSSTVEFNGTALSTTFVNATTLTAIVPHTAIMSVIPVSITVTGSTGSAALTIQSSVPPSAQTLTISGLVSPVRLAFDPDGALLVAEQQTAVSTAAIVRVTISSGVGTVHPWATFSVNTSTFYLGLLGMAPDPANPPTASGGDAYIFYTAVAGDNRIAKVSLISGTVTVTDLVTGLPVVQSGDQTWLNGGKLAIHTDATSGTTYIYASTGGSDLDPSWSQDSSGTGTGLHGKILRYNTDGSIPTDNPFGSSDPVYACGFRNSFGFDFHPTSPSGALYASDNGNENPGSPVFPWYDALDRVLSGDAEGYGFTSGDHCQSSVTSPLWGGSSADAPLEIAPTGTIFYTGTVFPQLQNSVLITGDNINSIYQYEVDEYGSPAGVLLGSPTSIMTFTDSGLTDLAQGPDGCVYAVAEGNGVIYRMTATPNTCQ
jgi:glucose/arabinose dehydrogenase